MSGEPERPEPQSAKEERRSGVDTNVLILAISLVIVVLSVLFVNVSADLVTLTKLVIIEMVGLFMLIILFASHLWQVKR